MTIYGELERSLESVPRLPRDAASISLALRYAGALDDCFDVLTGADASEDPAHHARVVLEISRLGGRLEAMLDRLGMAPSARPLTREEGGPGATDPASRALDALRADSASGYPGAGVDYTAAVDPAVTEADTWD